jgi:ACS family tartrate transporter-like MFS transporter
MDDKRSQALAEANVLRKVAWRLIPLMGLLYVLAFLDRVNVGFAALTMNANLAFSATVFGNGAGIFFLGYVLFEIPSNLMLHKMGARRWIARIMISWGVLSAGMAFIRTPLDFYVLRFLLGVAEAGFFPGMILYLTYWFPSQQRTRTLGAFLVALPVASVIGAPVSTLLIDLKVGSLHGWQWLFLLEGIPAALVGFLVLGILSDRPANASWINADEKRVLIQLLARDQTTQAASTRTAIQALNNRRVWLLGVVYLALLTGLYGFNFWLPQIIQNLDVLTHREIGVLAVVPNFVASVMMYGWARHSDATNERRWHLAIPALVGALGLATASQVSQPFVLLLALTFGAAGIYATLPIFWAMPSETLEGAAAASGFALINAVGNLGGYLGPALMGYSKDTLGSFGVGLKMLAFSLALTGFLALRIRTFKTGSEF